MKIVIASGFLLFPVVLSGSMTGCGARAESKVLTPAAAPSPAVSVSSAAAPAASAVAPASSAAARASSAAAPAARERAHAEGPIDIDVRSERPSLVSWDGDVTEWKFPERSTPSRSRLALVFSPTSWSLAFDLRGDFKAGVTLDIALPGGELPSIGALVRGGGTEAVNCDRERFSDEVQVRFDQDACRSILARYEKAQRAEAARFLRRLRIDESAVQRSEAGRLAPVTPLQRACRKESERLRCELELPLSALPRTSVSELGSVGLRPSPLDQAHLVTDAPAPLDEKSWYGLPVPVAFEPGAELRASVFSTPGEILPERDRHSYQPGEGLIYEVAERSGGRGMVDVSQWKCDPQTEVARLGDVMLGFACNAGFIFYRGEFKGRYSASSMQRVLSRAGALWVLSPRSWIEDSVSRSFAAWIVTRIDSQGTVQVVELGGYDYLWDTVIPTHDKAYDVLKLEGSVRTNAKKYRRVSVAWKWNPATLAYEVQGAASPPRRIE